MEEVKLDVQDGDGELVDLEKERVELAEITGLNSATATWEEIEKKWEQLEQNWKNGNQK